MSIAQLIPLLLNLSMGIIVLALGLRASLDEATWLLRRPSLLGRSFIAMHVVMLAFALLAVSIFPLQPTVKIAIVALAISPVPPISPGKQTKAWGNPAYVVSLLVTMAVLSIVVVPVGTLLIGAAYGLDGWVPLRSVSSVVGMTIIVPLVIGLLVRHYAPDAAAKIARPVSLVGTILLILAFLPILFSQWQLILSAVGNGTLLMLALFAVVGIAVGHFLAGPDPDDRSVLALASATRHPGVALAVAAATFPDQHAVVAVVLWHLVVGSVVSIPYVRWRQHAHGGVAAKVHS